MLFWLRQWASWHRPSVCLSPKSWRQTNRSAALEIVGLLDRLHVWSQISRSMSAEMRFMTAKCGLGKSTADPQVQFSERYALWTRNHAPGGAPTIAANTLVKWL